MEHYYNSLQPILLPPIKTGQCLVKKKCIGLQNKVFSPKKWVDIVWVRNSVVAHLLAYKDNQRIMVDPMILI